MVRQQIQLIHPGKDLGGGKGGIPLTTLPGRETTSDTLLLADIASSIPYRVCFDLGTGTGGIFVNSLQSNGLRIGIDSSMEALAGFDRSFGNPVLCPVERVSEVFKGGSADLVVANPPYFTEGSCRRSPDPNRDKARSGEPLTLFRFIFAGAYLLHRGGSMAVSARKNDIGRVTTGMLAAGFISPKVIAARGVFAVKAVLGLPS